MKVACAYTRITGPGKTERYQVPAERFLRTYRKFKPRFDHELIVVRNRMDQDSMFDGVATRYLDYFGGGWDCGTWAHLADAVECDFLICFNSFTYFHRPDWMEKFVSAFSTYGFGVYGTRGSYEWNPHLGTPCLAFTPALVRGYPYRAFSRDTAATWEAGIENLTVWARKAGFFTMQVTGHGVHGMDHWRQPGLSNIFRRGDQSQMLVWDRHSDVFAGADKEFKAYLAASADTRRQPRITP